MSFLDGGNGLLDDSITIGSDKLNECWESVMVYGRIPVPRHAHSCTLIGDTIWIFGGYGLGGVHLGDLNRFDILTGQWHRIKTSAKINARHSHTAVEYGGCLWVFGGIGKGSDDNVYNDLWMFSPATDQWTQITHRGVESSAGSRQPDLAGSAWTPVPRNGGDRQQADHSRWLRRTGLSERHVRAESRHDGLAWNHGGQRQTRHSSWRLGGQSDYNENDIYRYQLDRKKNNQPSSSSSLSSTKQLSLNFETLVDNPIFSDIKFLVEDKIINAHKCILYSRNQHFKAMITSGMKESTEDIITISDVSYEAFKAIIHYIYTGQLHFHQVDILELLSLSDRYLIDDVKHQCTKYLINHINSNQTNLASLKSIAETFNLSDLLKKILIIEDNKIKE
ncbi:hypothetical protein PPL_00597 [Heterostelium album PN500]|uniref:BTB domain-containing protein n=1 Tax=Heterostelium pallidum (strain ATCC 26659 / Pp 5 / PN500) TaxID=670386 RepID=D3AWW9_HETP5|nr:hypothetical protein PPL_00597 [Heterostelium album PN500]EFA86792.1 hypothetical protein PPL_00597 [Heterostelium album PN500]|eukprot:XP_020438896.1 hypothetical protein PPL_00597 [Heterostelium album PN500]